MFEPLGLDETAIAVYRTLLTAPRLTPQGLTVATGLNPAQVLAVLDLLEEKGFLRRSHNDPGELRTESPLVAFERLIGRHEEALHRSQEQLSSMRAGSAELVEEYHRVLERTRLGQIEHIVETDEIVARVLELGQNVERSVDTLLTSTPTRHQLDQAMSDEGAMLGRGVRLRSIYPAAARHDDGVVEYAGWLQGRGGAARTVLSVPNQTMLYDGEVAVLMFNHADFTRGAIVLSAPGAVVALQSLFDLLWESGTDLVEPPSMEELRPEERELLQLLGRGMKDEAVARALGISIRTVRRMINILSERLDAPSRFTLGARAHERGLI
jgi:DNA-binding CsgD family transcriptional regulator/DNA-binding MarR family transcriptional regulator